MAAQDTSQKTHPFFASEDAGVKLVELPAGWDAATSFHRLKRQLPGPVRQIVRERAVDVILSRARAMLRHAARPSRSIEDRLPGQGELDLEATLEQPRPWEAQDLIVRRNEPREAEVVAVLDMSLSMTGEKIALTALSAAILRLKLEHVAVVAFDTEAHLLVRVGESVTPRELVRRVLEVPAQGYTNIEAGLRLALRELQRSNRRERVGILLSDGIYNVGWDPVRVAARYPRLHVVQVGQEERQGTKTCTRMASVGRGRLYRAVTYEDLPRVVRTLVREVFRA